MVFEAAGTTSLDVGDLARASCEKRVMFSSKAQHFADLIFIEESIAAGEEGAVSQKKAHATNVQ